MRWMYGSLCLDLVTREELLAGDDLVEEENESVLFTEDDLLLLPSGASKYGLFLHALVSISIHVLISCLFSELNW